MTMTLDFVCESQVTALQSSIFFSFKAQLFIKFKEDIKVLMFNML